MLYENIIEQVIKWGNNMTETKITFEQYCTHLDKNVTMVEIFSVDGVKRIICTDTKCMNSEKGCKNKLRLLTER